MKPARLKPIQAKEKERTEVVTLKLTPKERAILENKAEQYAGGNRSEYLRYLFLKLTPREEDVLR